MRLNLSDEEKFDLERRFADFRYHGVSLGRSLKSYFGVTLDASIGAAVSSFVHWLYLIMFGPRRRGERHGMSRGKVLFALSGNTDRLKRLVFPIANAFDSNERSFLFWDKSAAISLEDASNWCDMHFVRHKSGIRARFAAFRGLFRIVRIFVGWAHAHNLPLRLSWGFVRYVSCLYGYIDGIRSFLEEDTPKCVVVDYEHFYVWSSLIQLAQGMSIPTMTLMHGEIYSAYGYTPVIADKVAVWGESQKRQLVGYGVDARRIVVCGCPRIEPNVCCAINREAVIARLGLPPTKPIALLATNPVLPEYRIRQVKDFCEALKGVEEIQGVVRLHPSESRSVYEGCIEQCPWVRFYEAKEWTVEESLGIARVVVNHDSGFGADALVYGCPVIELDDLPGGLTNGKKFVDGAGCPCVRGIEGLRNELVQAVEDDAYYNHLLRISRPFVKDIFFSFGDVAAKNTVGAIMELANR